MGKKDMDKSPKKVKILSKHMDRISIASVCKSNNRIKIKTLRYLFSPITLKKNMSLTAYSVGKSVGKQIFLHIIGGNVQCSNVMVRKIGKIYAKLH